MTFLDTLYDVTHVYYTCSFFFFSSPYFSLSFFVHFFFLLSWSNEGFLVSFLIQLYRKFSFLFCFWKTMVSGSWKPKPLTNGT